jgi:hypothetical protein
LTATRGGERYYDYLFILGMPQEQQEGTQTHFLHNELLPELLPPSSSAKRNEQNVRDAFPAATEELGQKGENFLRCVRLLATVLPTVSAC